MAEDFQEFIEKVKQASRLEDVIEETGPDYKLQRRHGRYMRGETHDSLIIRTDEQYFVWNANNERGDVFNWLQARRNWDFWEALQFLAERAKIEMPQRFEPGEKPQRVAARLKEDVFGLAAKVFAELLWKDAEALAYCRGRGWTDETIRNAGIGFTGRDPAAAAKRLRGEFSLHGLDPESPLAVAILGFRGDVRGWGKAHDIVVQDNWIEWGAIPGLIGKTRIVYPHYASGKAKYFSARNILGAETTKEGRLIKSYNLPKALVGERQVFYNYAYGRGADEVVLIEGQADAITLAQWEIPAIALVGTSWQDHAELLEELKKRHPRRYVGLDADKAGVQALVGKDQDWPLAQLMGAMARVVRWPSTRGPEGEDGKDANDWLRWLLLPRLVKKLGDEPAAADLLAGQRAAAEELLAGALTFAEEAARWAGGKRGADRDEAMKQAFRIIAQLDTTELAFYRKPLAEALGIGLREFANIVKAAAGETDERPLDFRETLGGMIDGWLVEYVYDPEQDRARLAWRDPDGKVGVSDHLDLEGVRYIPKYPTGFIKDGGVLFPSDLGQLKPTRELVAICEAFVNEHYLLGSKYLGRIIAYYIMMTWVYDSFNALPYLRAVGEAGAGKSELMRRVGHLCYRLLTSSGASTSASFFRATEMYRGTVFIDEADLHDGGDMSNDIVKFLNLGAMRGNPIWRLEEVMTENGKSYEVATFSTFCPKLIAMRRDFKDDAVGTRSITLKLMPREPMELKAAGIRLYIDEEFRQRATKIRNLLLRWRLQHWQDEIPVTEDLMDLEISSRLNQVTMPLKALATDDPELMDEIERFLRAYNAEIVLTRSMSIAARVVEALWKIWTDGDMHKELVGEQVDGTPYIMMGDVAKVANRVIDNMNDDDEEDEDDKPKRKKKGLTARGAGHIIRSELQLNVGERMARGFPVYWDHLKLEALAKRYGVPYYDPEKLNGKAPSGENKDGQAPKQTEIPF